MNQLSTLNQNSVFVLQRQVAPETGVYLYKSDEYLDWTVEQGDFSVIGVELINFISIVTIYHTVCKARQAELSKKMTYGDLMDGLSSTWRRTDVTASSRTGADTVEISISMCLKGWKPLSFQN